MKYTLLVIILFLSFVPLIVEAKQTNDPPLPYTTPHIFYQGSKIRVNWYNTIAKTYTMLEYKETCTKTTCISFMRIAWRGYLPIGNVRITLKTNTRTHTHSVYRIY